MMAFAQHCPKSFHVKRCMHLRSEKGKHGGSKGKLSSKINCAPRETRWCMKKEYSLIETSDYDEEIEDTFY